jgi:luciferase family oxidoreductase group 1
VANIVEMKQVPEVGASSQTIRLSVLDTALIAHTAEQALADSIALARQAERLGYARYWLAEHHGRTAGAGSAPVVTATAVAGATKKIHVGPGGIMIPNHVPLVVAEQFGTLAALHPGRIDLGVGRASPPDAATATVLGHYLQNYGADDFADRVDQLVGFLTGRFPSGRELDEIYVSPRAQQPPTVWVLGTSQSAASVAAMLGLPFAFAHHFGRGDAAIAFAHYRANFRPSATLDKPYTLLTVLTVVAPTDEQAALIAGSADLYFYQFFRTRRAMPRLPSVDEVRQYSWSEDLRSFAAGRRAGQAVGSPEHAGAVLDDLLRRTSADELKLTTQMHSLDDRIRSLELVAALLPNIAHASREQTT